MQNAYAGALRRVLVSEGGRVDNPKDPGGRTNKGITQRVYSAWLHNQGKAPRDVWSIDDAEVAAIYKAQYWDKIHGDDLPAGVDYVLFDAAVMSGPVQAVKWLQRGLHLTAVDGMIGVATLAAVAGDDDNDALVADICQARLAFCKHLKTWRTFGSGWEKRIDHVEAVGQEQASGSVGRDPVYFPGSEAKADIKDAKRPPPIATASAVASGGAATTAVTTVTSQLQPISGLIPHYDQAVAAAMAVAGAVTVVGGAWLWCVKRRAAARAIALDLPNGAPAAPAAA